MLLIRRHRRCLPWTRLWGFAVFCCLVSEEPLSADDRSTELLRYSCSNSLGRRDITLFANGTVRVREGSWEDQKLYLDELLPEELASTIGQLGEIQTSADPIQTEFPRSAPSGDWVDQCEILLALPSAASESWSFSNLQVPPLAVGQLVQLAEDLASYTRTPMPEQRVLPLNYKPRRGDILRELEGGRFKVIDLTTDGLGVELEGLDSPLRIFVPIAEIAESFRTLEGYDDR